MKYRLLSLALAALLIMSGTAVAEHTHTPSPQWDRDLKAHWHPCLECGEKLNLAVHQMSNETCTVCESEIWLFDDGMGDVTNYNAYGDWTRLTSFEADGTVSYDNTFEYEYDAQGNLKRSKQYLFGALVEEITYTVNALGERQFVKQIGYYDDGTYGVNDYDEKGDLIKAAVYDAAGKMLFEETIEYAANALDGSRYEAKRTSLFEDGSGSVMENNAYGDRVSIVYYRADGSVDFRFDHEYEYDADGLKMKERTLHNGKLQEETTYTVYEDDTGRWTNPVTTIYYEEDGTQTITHYDENGNEQTGLEESVG